MSEAGWTVYATARSESALARLDQLHHVHAVPLDITDRTAIAALRCPGRKLTSSTESPHRSERTTSIGVDRSCAPEYPFTPVAKTARWYTERQSLRIFYQDGSSTGTPAQNSCTCVRCGRYL
jgi:hypothetical protein